MMIESLERRSLLSVTLLADMKPNVSEVFSVPAIDASAASATIKYGFTPRFSVDVTAGSLSGEVAIMTKMIGTGVNSFSQFDTTFNVTGPAHYEAGVPAVLTYSTSDPAALALLKSGAATLTLGSTSSVQEVFDNATFQNRLTITDRSIDVSTLASAVTAVPVKLVKLHKREALAELR